MIKTYKYGILPPTGEALLVRDQIKRGHDYQNKLIEIEIWRRNELRALEKSKGNIPDLEKKINEIEVALRDLNKSHKSANAKLGFALVKEGKMPQKQKILPEDKLFKEKLKNSKKEFSLDLKEERKKVRENLSEERTKITKQRDLKVSEATRSELSPYQGTYLLIRDAFGIRSSKGKTTGMPLYDGIEPNNPKFRRFIGEGRIGIGQFSPSEPFGKVFGIQPTSKWLQIVPILSPPLRKDGKIKKIGSKDLRLLRIRIGTIEGTSAPIWGEFPMVYHRCIPSNSVVKLVQISCRKIAHRERWTVSITVDDQNISPLNTNELVVGFDLGYRSVPEGLRVAKWEGSDGKKGEVIIPSNVLDRLKKVEKIKSGRDLDFDRLKILLSLFVERTNVPDWLKDEIKFIEKWRSQGRAVALLKRWKDKRFTGDEEIWPWLDYWRYHDFHLYNYERSLDIKARGYRNEIYRIAAAKLVDQYGTLVFENVRLDNMAKSKIAGSNRFLAAPSEFRNACKNATRTRNKNYGEVNAAYTTKLHASKNDGTSCGHLNDIGGKMEYICAGCGEELDRDENAAHNILYRWTECERSGSEQNTASARTLENFNENKALADLDSDTCSDYPIEANNVINNLSQNIL